MRNIPNKILEKIKTRNSCSIIFFFSGKGFVCEIILKNYDRTRQARDDNTIRLMRIALCISKATDTHTEYVIIIAFDVWLTVHRNSVWIRKTN